MTGEILLKVQKLSGIYKVDHNVFRAVDSVDFWVYSREILGLVGESGSGKTTLLKLLTGAPMPPLYYESGDVILEGITINRLSLDELRTKVLGKLVAYVPQVTFDAIYPYRRIWQFYLDMLRERGEDADEKKVREYLGKWFEALGLESSIINRYPFELSGGMRQRAVIALVSSLKPSLILLDEPTSALDVITARRVLEFIVDLFRKEHFKSAIISSHDIATLRQVTHRLCVMYAGKIVEIGNTDDILENPLHPYTQILINAVRPLDRFESRKKYRVSITVPVKEISVVRLIMMLPGCRFHPRCPFAMDICRRELPPMIDMGGGRYVSCWLYAKK